MQERIAKALAKRFQAHRLVFWYDEAREFTEVFAALEVEGVEKLTIANNEFALKHRVLREAPKQNFLLYKPGPRPVEVDNWLLDLELAYDLFRTDQVAIWLADLGLPANMDDLVRAHAEFFRAGKRLAALKARMPQKLDEASLRLVMLSICARAEGGLDTVLEALLFDLSRNKDDAMRLITRVGLADFLWAQLGQVYGYHSETPSVEDFAISLFKSCYRSATGGDPLLSGEATVFFRRWKNNRNAAEAFATLSGRFADAIAPRDALATLDFRNLVDVDYFEEVDRTIIRALVHEVGNQTVGHAEVQGWVRKRRQSHWYEKYSDLYEAIRCAAEFQNELAQATLGMTSLAEGVERYSKSWFRIDQLYRKFILHMQNSAQASLMGDLFTQIENHYVNSYLLRLNDAWQVHVDAADEWKAGAIPAQRSFYQKHVAEYRRKDQKICVIISDALRYEIAEEFLGKVRSMDRFDARIEPMFGSLPSYTQLGMASLLPNTSLEITDNKSATVFVDGLSSQGLENRKKILAKGRDGDRTTALKADALMAMRGDAAKQLFRDHDVIYVYHNVIDATGDKPASEERVFEAAEDTMDDLEKLVKKLTSANARAIIVTADHGFIYQHRPIEESDFSSAEIAGTNVVFRDRRFVLGHGLQAGRGLRHFRSEQVGLAGDLELLIPKSINRLRLKGSGSRYVHGGASLQEMVIPVVRINKKRKSDISSVDVEIIGSTNRTVTTSQLSVRFYQTQPATDKFRPRHLIAGIYSITGELISDRHDLTFDYSSENARERETSVRFLLSRNADAFDGQEIFLKLEEQLGETTHYREYQKLAFTLRRSFSNDFDF